jgi:hypothetical protein
MQGLANLGYCLHQLCSKAQLKGEIYEYKTPVMLSFILSSGRSLEFILCFRSCTCFVDQNNHFSILSQSYPNWLLRSTQNFPLNGLQQCSAQNCKTSGDQSEDHGRSVHWTHSRSVTLACRRTRRGSNSRH